MSQLGSNSTMRRGRFQTRLMRVCALILILSLLIYAISFTGHQSKPNQYLEPWDFSMLFKNAAYKFQEAIKQQKIPRERKLVLLWTNYFSANDWLPSTVDLECPVTDCDVTSNRSLLLNSSAVIMHWRNIETTDLPECVSSETVQCPLWVLFNKEAPPHTPIDILKSIQDKVHWTVTYRKDSDVYAPYGKVVPKKNRSSIKSDFEGKQSLLCWLVSNCNTPSRREVFVSELEKYIQLDIYGKCGKKQCPHKLVIDCYRWLSSRCMFYLSFENSICKDYTTEKLYHALSSDMIPVVMGNISNYNHLPPRSFINAADFSSPKELAQYLVKIAKDTGLYKSYFRWKMDYEVKDQSYLWFCDICQKLHDTKLESVKPGRNLVSWWFGQSGCTSWTDL